MKVSEITQEILDQLLADNAADQQAIADRDAAIDALNKQIEDISKSKGNSKDKEALKAASEKIEELSRELEEVKLFNDELQARYNSAEASIKYGKPVITHDGIQYQLLVSKFTHNGVVVEHTLDAPLSDEIIADLLKTGSGLLVKI